jgi:hypothetical protein
MDLSRLSTATKVITGAAILLLIDSFLDWQQFCAGSFCTGVSGWHGTVGVIMGLLIVLLIVWQVIKIAGVELPELPVPDKQIEAGVAGLLVIFVILKFITANEARHWWVQLVGLILTGVIAWYEWQRWQGADDDAPVAASVAASPAAAPAPPAAPAAPAAPSEPAAPEAPVAPVAPAAPMGGAPVAAEPDVPAADEPGDAPSGGTTY